MSESSNSQEDAFAAAPRTEKRRYYFDVDDGASIAKDKEGLALDGLESVHQEVLRALPEVVRGLLPDDERRDFVIEVKDETGQTVLRAKLSLTVELLKNLP
jgi:hypothetical protein